MALLSFDGACLGVSNKAAPLKTFCEAIDGAITM
jgi:hypothetical protein